MRCSYFSCCCNFLTKTKEKLYFKGSIFSKTNLPLIFLTLAIFIFYNKYYELVFWNQSVDTKENRTENHLFMTQQNHLFMTQQNHLFMECFTERLMDNQEAF